MSIGSLSKVWSSSCVVLVLSPHTSPRKAYIHVCTTHHDTLWYVAWIVWTIFRPLDHVRPFQTEGTVPPCCMGSTQKFSLLRVAPAFCCISIYFELLAAWSDGFANGPDPSVLAFPGKSIARVNWVNMLHCCKRTVPRFHLMMPPEAMGPNLRVSAKRKFSIKAACFVDHSGTSIMFNLWYATSARWSHQAQKRLRNTIWVCLRWSEMLTAMHVCLHLPFLVGLFWDFSPGCDGCVSPRCCCCLSWKQTKTTQ